MSESEDVRIHDPASKQKEPRPYGERDLENVMKAREWRNWDELIDWLRTEGDKMRGLTPGEVKQMIQDFSQMKEKGEPLPTDPHELYQRVPST